MRCGRLRTKSRVGPRCDEDGHTDRSVPRARARILRAAATLSRAQALPVPIQALHLVVGAPSTRDSRRVRQSIRPERYETYGPSSWAAISRPIRPVIQGGVPRSLCCPLRAARMPVFHSVGASDPLDASDMQTRTRLDDGLRTPSKSGFRETPDPIQDQAQWRESPADFERVVRIDRIVNGVQAARGVTMAVPARLNEGVPT